jgi:hypothetical protein
LHPARAQRRFIDVEEWKKRLAVNEAWFREINDRIEANALEHGSDPHLYEFICECANIDCAERMRMTLFEYEQLRAHPARFAIVPGHEQPEIETVVERNTFWVVEKKGLAARVVGGNDA